MTLGLKRVLPKSGKDEREAAFMSVASTSESGPSGVGVPVSVSSCARCMSPFISFLCLPHPGLLS